MNNPDRGRNSNLRLFQRNEFCVVDGKVGVKSRGTCNGGRPSFFRTFEEELYALRDVSDRVFNFFNHSAILLGLGLIQCISKFFEKTLTNCVNLLQYFKKNRRGA